VLPPPLPPLPPSPVRFRDLLLLAVLVVISVFAIPLVLTLFAPDVNLAGLGAVVGLFVGQSVLMLFFTWLAVLRPHGLSLADIGLRPTYQSWYRIAVAVGLLCLPLVTGVNLAVQSLLGEAIRNPQMEALAPEGFSWTGLVLMLALVGVLVPFIEEVIFRGLLLGWLCKHLRFVFAAPLSAVIFSVAHGLWQLIPALAVMGLVLAVMAWRSGSLWPSIIVHGVFNSVMTITLYAGLAGLEGF
jgi:membrane protease YdiL (CAAX protease family)